MGFFTNTWGTRDNILTFIFIGTKETVDATSFSSFHYIVIQILKDYFIKDSALGRRNRPHRIFAVFEILYYCLFRSSSVQSPVFFIISLLGIFSTILYKYKYNIIITFNVWGWDTLLSSHVVSIVSAILTRGQSPGAIYSISFWIS